MFCCIFEVNWWTDRGMPTPPMNFGKPMMPNRHTRMVAAITLAFNVKFRCMEIYAFYFAVYFVGAACLPDPSVGTRVLTEDRANCNFRLSGFTLNTIVSPSTAVM